MSVVQLALHVVLLETPARLLFLEVEHEGGTLGLCLTTFGFHIVDLTLERFSFLLQRFLMFEHPPVSLFLERVDFRLQPLLEG